jgi:hypothetical protein
VAAVPRILAVLLALAPALFSQPGAQWKIQYSYQKIDSALDLRDIQCPSALRCVAAGLVQEKTGGLRGVVILTADGGKQWSMIEVKEHPVSLFFLSEAAGWMVTDRGIWFTEESGRVWKKLEGMKGILRVHFLDLSHGYAIGFPKAVYETLDGGKKWTKLAVAQKPPTDSDHTVYDNITFLGQRGVIVGNVLSEDDERAPIWLDPSLARYRRERQSKVAVLETRDGGKTWESSSFSIVGKLTQLRLEPDGPAVILVEYKDYFALPSSVYRTKLTKNGPQTVFEERDRAVSDVTLLPDGSAMIAAIETPGSSNQVPIPGKLKMYRSTNWRVWEEMDADYRAIAQRAVLGAADAHHVWVATDTGMILNLVDSEMASH